MKSCISVISLEAYTGVLQRCVSGDVVLDSVNMAFKNEDNILYQIRGR